jgi:hypothetical protein
VAITKGAEGNYEKLLGGMHESDLWYAPTFSPLKYEGQKAHTTPEHIDDGHGVAAYLDHRAAVHGKMGVDQVPAVKNKAAIKGEQQPKVEGKTKAYTKQIGEPGACKVTEDCMKNVQMCNFIAVSTSQI